MCERVDVEQRRWGVMYTERALDLTMQKAAWIGFCMLVYQNGQALELMKTMYELEHLSHWERSLYFNFFLNILNAYTVRSINSEFFAGADETCLAADLEYGSFDVLILSDDRDNDHQIQSVRRFFSPRDDLLPDAQTVRNPGQPSPTSSTGASGTFNPSTTNWMMEEDEGLLREKRSPGRGGIVSMPFPGGVRSKPKYRPLQEQAGSTNPYKVPQLPPPGRTWTRSEMASYMRYMYRPDSKLRLDQRTYQTSNIPNYAIPLKQGTQQQILKKKPISTPEVPSTQTGAAGNSLQHGNVGHGTYAKPVAQVPGIPQKTPGYTPSGGSNSNPGFRSSSPILPKPPVAPKPASLPGRQLTPESSFVGTGAKPRPGTPGVAWSNNAKDTILRSPAQPKRQPKRSQNSVKKNLVQFIATISEIVFFFLG